MNIYPEGAYVAVTFTVTDDLGAAVDPTTVRFAYIPPGGTEIVLSVAGGGLSVVDTLTYSFDLPTNGLSGNWTGVAYRVVSGEIRGVKEWAMKVQPANIPRPPDATAVPPVDPGSVTADSINVLDYGARGDAPMDGTGAGTDDTGAFQLALTALAARKGGRLIVPAFDLNGTPLRYRVKGPLSFDTGSGASYNQFEIDATGAIIWADWASAHQVWFTIGNTFLRIRGLTIMGWNGSYPPTLPTYNPFQVFLANSSEVRFDDCLLSGIKLDSSPPGNSTAGGVIASESSTILIDEVRADSIVNTTIIPFFNARHWKHVGIRGLKMADLFTWNNQSGSLGAGVGPMIVFGKPHADTRSAPISRNGHAYIEQSNLDEGPGSIMVGGLVKSDASITNLVATLLASYTQPSYPSSFPVTSGMTVNVNVSDTSWMETGDTVNVAGGGWYQVFSVVDSTHVRLWNMDVSNAGANGNAASGATVSSSGSPLIKGQGPISVRIEDLDMNHGQIGSPLIDLRGVMHATVRNVFGRETGSAAIKARYCTGILVDGWETRYAGQDQVRTVDIDSTNSLAVFRDSDLDTSGSTATQTIVDKAGARSLARYTTAGLPSAATVQSGTAVWDTTLKHVKVSDGSSWVDLSVSGGNDATSIQGFPVDTTDPVTGQVLQLSAGGVYVPTTLASSANPQASAIDWVAQFVARGGTAPNVNIGGYTVGSWFYLAGAGLITGARIYILPGLGGAKNIKVSLWRANASANSYTRLESQTISVNASGLYSVTWAGGGGAGGSWSISGSDLYRRYAVTFWATDSSFYQAPVLGSGGISTKPYPPVSAAINVPLCLKPGLWLETWYTGTTAQADGAPEDANGTSTGNSSLCEPVVTITG